VAREELISVFKLRLGMPDIFLMDPTFDDKHPREAKERVDANIRPRGTELAHPSQY